MRISSLPKMFQQFGTKRATSLRFFWKHLQIAVPRWFPVRRATIRCVIGHSVPALIRQSREGRLQASKLPFRLRSRSQGTIHETRKDPTRARAVRIRAIPVADPAHVRYSLSDRSPSVGIASLGLPARAKNSEVQKSCFFPKPCQGVSTRVRACAEYSEISP
jgi:hypothetical protein